MEQVVRETGLFRKTLGGEIIRVALRGDCLDRYIAFCYKVLDVGVHEAEGDAEAAAQVALRKGVIVGKLVEDLQRLEMVGPGRGWTLIVHIVNIACLSPSSQGDFLPDCIDPVAFSLNLC